MRKLRPIDALLPKTRQRVLATIFNQPERRWFLTELAAHLQTSPSSLQRELASLVASGILRRVAESGRTYFQAETEAAIFDDLRALITRSLGVETRLRETVEAFDKRIACAFIYGSSARAEDTALSDVDLMIVGQIGLADLAPKLRALEREFNREVNATCYRPSEFRRKAKTGNHFLLEVINGKKTFLKGTEDELAKLAGE